MLFTADLFHPPGKLVDRSPSLIRFSGGDAFLAPFMCNIKYRLIFFQKKNYDPVGFDKLSDLAESKICGFVEIVGHDVAGRDGGDEFVKFNSVVEGALCFFAIGNIPVDGKGGRDLSVHTDGRSQNRDIDKRSIFAAAFSIHDNLFALGCTFGQAEGFAIMAFGRDHWIDEFSCHFDMGIAEEPFEFAVDSKHTPSIVCHNNGLLGVLE